MLSAAEAGRQTGKTKQAIAKALRNGRLSGKKNADGEWEVDPAELFRVYPKVETGNDNQFTKGSSGLHLQIDLLRKELTDKTAKLAEKDEQLRELKDDKGRLLGIIEKQADQVRLLADQRQHRPWWRRIWDKQPATAPVEAAG